MEDDINQLIYIKTRQPLLELDDEHLSIRRPSTEQQMADRGTKLLQRYNRLQDALSDARANIWKVVEFGDIKDGAITLKAFNEGKYTAILQEIRNYLLQSEMVEAALRKLSEIGAPFDSEINQKLQKLEYRIRQLNSMIESLKHSTRVEENKPQIKVAEKELAALEKELAKNQDVKRRMNDVFDGLLFQEAVAKDV